MNPGPVEEISKSTNIFLDIMRREPRSLALVIMNVGLLLLFYVILSVVAEQRKREVNQLYVMNKEVRDLLSRCIVPERRSDNM